jgi:hypothetical protein
LEELNSVRIRLFAASLASIATLGLCLAGPIGAATVHHHLGPRPEPGRLPWITCVPRAELHWQAYRVDNDLFVGMRGKSCIKSTTGRNFVILDNYDPNPLGIVTGYPAVRYGPYYAATDPLAILPLRTTRIGHLTAHVDSKGRARGQWQSDADIWFYPRFQDVSLHGSFELVIVTRASAWTGELADKVHIFKRGWSWAEWMTCDRAEGGQLRAALAGQAIPAITKGGGCVGPEWPLMYFRIDHYTDRLRLRLGAFTYLARRFGGLPWRWVMGSVAYGTECWSGCRGLVDSMFVDDPRHVSSW